jgi:hypothetical protein
MLGYGSNNRDIGAPPATLEGLYTRLKILSDIPRWIVADLFQCSPPPYKTRPTWK